MRITSAGNVGIGTTSPDNISSTGTVLSISTQGALTTNSLAGSLTFLTNDASFTNTYADGVTTEISSICESTTGAAYGLSFSTSTITSSNRAERLRITATGNVGIGTTTPFAKFHVKNGNTLSSALTNTSALIEGFSQSILQIASHSSGFSQIAFGDQDDGFDGGFIYSNASRYLSIETANAERMRINSSGNVAIGTTIPSAKLHVQGSSGNSSLLLIRDTNSTLGTKLATFIQQDGTNNPNLDISSNSTGILVNTGFSTGIPGSFTLQSNGGNSYIAFNTSGANERMRIKNNGNVGIGTISPVSPLTVKSNSVSSGESGIVIQANGNTNSIIKLGERATDGARLEMLDAGVTKIALFTDGTDNYINAGNVGIGTTNPGGKLDIYYVGTGGTGTQGIGEGLNISSFTPNITFNDNSASVDNYAIHLNQSVLTLGRYTSATSQSPDLVLTAGKVGIGTVSPTEKLDISGTAIVRSTLFTVGNVHGFNPSFGASFFINNSGGTSYFNTTGGNVGIGTTSPTAKLHVAGTGLFTGLVSGITPVAAANFVTKAYVDGSGGGTGPFLPLAGGTMTGTAGVVFPDDFKLNLGAGSDLQIYHGGVNSHIDQNGSGDLYIKNTRADGDIFFQGDDGTGSAVANYFLINGGGQETRFQKNTRHNDNVLAQFGNSDDLQIFHDGSDSYINETGTGSLYLKSAISLVLSNITSGSVWIECINNQVELKNAGSTKLTTTSVGVTITGEAKANYFKAISSIPSETSANTAYLDFASGNTRIVSKGPDGTTLGGFQILQQASDTSPASTALSIDGNSNATFAGDINIGANHVGRDGDNYVGFETDNLIKFRVAGNTQVKIADGTFAPQTDSDIDLGSSSNRFKELWVDSINGGSVVPGSYLPLAGGTMTGTNGVLMPDNFRLKFGDATTPDLQIYHDGSHSYINDSGVGALKILASQLEINNAANSENIATFTQDGAVSLYYNGSKKFETTNTGVTVTGSGIFTGNLNVNGNATLGDATTDDHVFNGQVTHVTADALGYKLYRSNGSTSMLISATGDSEIEFGTDNGSGTNTTQWTIGKDSTDNSFRISNSASLGTSDTLTLAGANATFAGTVTAGSYFLGDDTSISLATTGAGTVFLRPNGQSSTAQSSFTTTLATIGTSIAITGAATATTATTSTDNNATLTTKGYVDGLVTGVPVYKGTWDASGTAGGTPDLRLAANKVLGNYYIVSTAGSATPNGAGTEPNSWNVGDWCIFSDVTPGAGTDLWQKIDNTSVISGAGTGQKVTKWDGTSGATSETLTDGPITFSGNNSTFAGNVTISNELTIAQDSASDRILFTRSGHDSFSLSLLGSQGLTITNVTDNRTDLQFSSSGKATFGGNVEINKTDPQIKLKAGTQDVAWLGDFGGGTDGQLLLFNNAGVLKVSLNGEANSYINGGNVGIGDTTPLSKLEVAGSIKSTNYDTSHTSESGVTLGYNATEAMAYLETWTSKPLTIRTYNYQAFNISGSEAMRIGTTRNVGIGTTSPSSKLTVSGPTTADLAGTNNSIRIENHTSANASPGQLGGGIVFSQKWWSGSASLRVTGGIFGIKNAGNGTFGGGLAFHTQPSSGANMIQRMIIDTSGNVGIGTTSPDANLEVVGTTVTSTVSDGVNAVLIGLAGSNRTTVQFDTADTTHTNRQWGLTNIAGDFYVGRHGLNVMTMLNNGDVGIGTTSPGAKLHLVSSGSDFFPLRLNSSSAKTWQIGVGGTNYYDGQFLLQDSSVGERLRINSAGTFTLPAYNSTNQTGTPTYLLGTDASGTVVKTLSTPSPITSQAASLYDLIPNGAFTTTYAFTSTAGTYAEVMEGSDVITASGTYSVQMFVNDFAVGGTQYSETYSGIMSWASATNTNNGSGDSTISEIVLHRSGHATNSGVTYLRTRETTSANGGKLKLEIMCNKTYTGASNVVFKFVRLI